MSVSLEEFKKILEQNLNNPDYVLIDVRTPEEFESGHIDGAINADFYDPGFRDYVANLDKQKNYLVYCLSGSRSGDTVELMQKAGIENIYELRDGINEWVRENNKIV